MMMMIIHDHDDDHPMMMDDHPDALSEITSARLAGSPATHPGVPLYMIDLRA